MGIPIGKLSSTPPVAASPRPTACRWCWTWAQQPAAAERPFYMGWRHPRISGEEYDEFVDAFIQAVKRRWPDILLQFEDFAQGNATPLLNRYKDELCCFNDDIQGTAAVTLGSLIAACKASGAKLSEKRVAFLGAGSAGCGIAEADRGADEGRRADRRRGAGPGLHGGPIRSHHRQDPQPARLPAQALPAGRADQGVAGGDNISLLEVMGARSPGHP